MARVRATYYANTLSKPHAREMDFTGRPLTGFSEEQQLRDWNTLCEELTSALPPKQGDRVTALA